MRFGKSYELRELHAEREAIINPLTSARNNAKKSFLIAHLSTAITRTSGQCRIFDQARFDVNSIWTMHRPSAVSQLIIAFVFFFCYYSHCFVRYRSVCLPRPCNPRSHGIRVFTVNRKESDRTRYFVARNVAPDLLHSLSH